MQGSRWALLLMLGVACFAEDERRVGDDDDDDASGTTGTGTATTVSSSMTASTTATTTSTTDASTTAATAEETTTGTPDCDGNVVEPADGLCARPSWWVTMAGQVASIRKAAFDGGADDLSIAVSGPPQQLAWILGGATPMLDFLDNVPPRTKHVVAPFDDAPGDDVMLVGSTTSAPDLGIYAWTDEALENIAQREPPSMEDFITATDAVTTDARQVAWLTSGDRIELAALDDLESAQTVAMISLKGFDLLTGRRGDEPVLFFCGQSGFDSFPIAPGATPLASHAFAEAGASLCAVADLDGDANADVVALRGDARSVTTVMAGDEASTFTEAGTADLDAEPREVAIGDLDGDGLPELVVRTVGLASLRVYWTVAGGAPEVGPLLELPDVPDAVAIGDFDGDNDADVAYAIGADVQLLAFGFD